MMAMMNTIFVNDNNDYRHNIISPYINGTNSNNEQHYGNNDNTTVEVMAMILLCCCWLQHGLGSILHGIRGIPFSEGFE